MIHLGLDGNVDYHCCDGCGREAKPRRRAGGNRGILRRGLQLPHSWMPLRSKDKILVACSDECAQLLLRGACEFHNIADESAAKVRFVASLAWKPLLTGVEEKPPNRIKGSLTDRVVRKLSTMFKGTNDG